MTDGPGHSGRTHDRYPGRKPSLATRKQLRAAFGQLDLDDIHNIRESADLVQEDHPETKRPYRASYAPLRRRRLNRSRSRMILVSAIVVVVMSFGVAITAVLVSDRSEPSASVVLPTVFFVPTGAPATSAPPGSAAVSTAPATSAPGQVVVPTTTLTAPPPETALMPGVVGFSGRISNDILFDRQTAELTPVGTAAIDQMMAEILDRFYSAKVDLKIELWTDDRGSQSSNARLSKARALAVQKYLNTRYGDLINSVSYAANGELNPPTACSGNCPSNRVLELTAAIAVP